MQGVATVFPILKDQSFSVDFLIRQSPFTKHLLILILMSSMTFYRLKGVLCTLFVLV